jgi:hypothetical protein
MTTTARILIDRAVTILNDATGGAATRWPDAEMFGWLTEGEYEALRINNKLYTKTVVRTLAAGARQDFSGLTDYYILLDVTRSMASDGVTPVRTMTSVAAALLDALDPAWHLMTQASALYHFTFRPDMRSLYQVYPPAVAGTKVELVYSAIPPTIAAGSDNIVLPDNAGPALVSYLCYRAMSKEAEFADSGEMAMAHYKLFTETVPTI